MTPIELLENALRKYVPLADVFVPEQCMTVYLHGKSYQVSIVEIEDDESTEEEQS